MKVNLCDICLAEGKRVLAAYKLSASNPAIGEKAAVDACNEHRNWLKDKPDWEARKKAVNEVRMSACRFAIN